MSVFLLEGLLQSALSTAVLILIIMPLQRCLKNRIQPRCFVWLCGIAAIRLMLPIPIMFGNTAEGEGAAALAEQMEESAVRAAGQEAIVSSFHIESEGTVLDIIFIIWLAGSLLFLVCCFANYYFFRRKMRLHGKKVGNLWDACCVQGIPATEKFKQIDILICGDAVSPMIIGYRKSYLCLPDKDWSDFDLHMIYLHEAAHARNHDLIWKLMFAIANALQWFNPLAYLLRANAEEYIELSCDNEVIKNMSNDQRKEYAEFLLYLLQGAKKRRTSLAMGTVESGRRLKTRFRILLDKAEKRRTKGLGICAACAVLMLLVQIPARCDILTTYYNNSYITIWYEEEGFQKSERIMLNSLYYGICESEGIVPKKAEQISGLEKISLEPGETLVLCASENAEAFDLVPGDIVEINIRIDRKALLKIGLTNGSSHETTDTRPKTSLIQEENEGSLIYICNRTSERIEFF